MALTDNKNFIKPTQFKLTLNSGDYANSQYFCVTASLPSINQAESALNFRNSKASMPGEKFEFDPLTLRIMLDEDMNAYKEIYQWMLDNRNLENKTADATLSILSSHNNTTNQIKFSGMFPISLGGVEFNAQDQAGDYLQFDVTFYYTYFELV